MEFMTNNSARSCTCPECIEMCRTYPCMPTVLEASRLINAGYADRLMLKACPASNDNTLVIPGLCPAIVGFEKSVGPLKMHQGPCTFLKGDRCELHDLGLKPAEGRFATHETTPEQEEKFMVHIMKTWATMDGNKLLLEWEKYCEIKIQGPGFS